MDIGFLSHPSVERALARQDRGVRDCIGIAVAAKGIEVAPGEKVLAEEAGTVEIAARRGGEPAESPLLDCDRIVEPAITAENLVGCLCPCRRADLSRCNKGADARGLARDPRTDRSQQMLCRHMMIETEAVEQSFLRHRALTHHWSSPLSCDD